MIEDVIPTIQKAFKTLQGEVQKEFELIFDLRIHEKKIDEKVNYYLNLLENLTSKKRTFLIFDDSEETAK